MPLDSERQLVADTAAMSILLEKEQSGCVVPSSVANHALRDILDRLTASNLSKYVEVPMICVIGGTSSGKSSLLSNLSMIELPSSHSLTTRCPVLIQMSRASMMEARIGVQWRSLGNSHKPLPHFQERTVNEHSWAKIPALLTEAQNFILQQHPGKEIASDVITLHVRGPDCTDLSLLDLPGLVYTRATNESDHIIQDVHAVLDEYLRNKRCIILAVVPGNIEFHNSNVIAEALKRDPLTERTIPVITKPDLIDPGAEGQVVELLLGKKLSFQLGFHMIKGRGQAALDHRQSIQDGLRDEDRFFYGVEPWRSVHNRNLLGTNNLRHKLASLQINHTRQQIPRILQEIRAKQQNAARTLKMMGVQHASAYDRRRYYQDVCQAILSQLDATLRGKLRKATLSNQPSAAASLHQATAIFVQQIQQGLMSTVGQVTEGAPAIVTHSRGVVRGEIVHLDQDFACVDRVDETDSESEVLFESIDMLSPEPVEENTVWSDGSKICIARANNRFDTLQKIPLHQIRPDPSWLKTKIQENQTDDLPCFLNVDTFKGIVSDFIEEDWKPHCMDLLDKTHQIVTNAVNNAIDESLTTDRYPALRCLIEQQCRQAVTELSKTATKQLLLQLEIEKHPFTAQANDLFESIAEARQFRLKRDLEIALTVNQEGVFDTQTMKTMVDNVFERNKQTSMDDYLADEMEIILKSYGTVATKRVLDRIPMISWEIFRSLTTTVQDSLWSVKDETIHGCMQETPEFTAKYVLASEELQEMNKAIAVLKRSSKD